MCDRRRFLCIEQSIRLLQLLGELHRGRCRTLPGEQEIGDRAEREQIGVGAGDGVGRHRLRCHVYRGGILDERLELRRAGDVAGRASHLRMASLAAPADLARVGGLAGAARRAWKVSREDDEVLPADLRVVESAALHRLRRLGGERLDLHLLGLTIRLHDGLLGALRLALNQHGPDRFDPLRGQRRISTDSYGQYWPRVRLPIMKTILGSGCRVASLDFDLS
jgi:hypothetical protein